MEKYLMRVVLTQRLVWLGDKENWDSDWDLPGFNFLPIIYTKKMQVTGGIFNGIPSKNIA